MERAVIGVAYPKLEAVIAGQTLRKDQPEEKVPERPNRWQAANGTTPPFRFAVAGTTDTLMNDEDF